MAKECRSERQEGGKEHKKIGDVRGKEGRRGRAIGGGGRKRGKIGVRGGKKRRGEKKGGGGRKGQERVGKRRKKW